MLDGFVVVISDIFPRRQLREHLLLCQPCLRADPSGETGVEMALLGLQPSLATERHLDVGCP